MVCRPSSGTVDVPATEARRLAIRRERLGREPNLTPFTRPAAGQSISEYLYVVDGRLMCLRCGTDISATDENYKGHLICREQALTSLAPVNRDPKLYIAQDVIFRGLFCPSCGTQIESEVALPDSPLEWDCQIR